MSRKNLYYMLLILGITNLHFEEYFGLNILISTLLFIIYHLITSKHTVHYSMHWMMALGLLFCNAFAIVLTGHSASFIWFIFALFYFISIHYKASATFPFALAHGFGNFFEGVYLLYTDLVLRFQKQENQSPKNSPYQVLIYVIPTLIILLFLKLYQAADATFYAWTKFINLDWISWPFLALFLILTIFLYGINHFRANEELIKMEAKKKQYIDVEQTDRLHHFLGFETESKIALTLFITLSLLLSLYLIIDLSVIILELPAPDTNFKYSQFLHQGVASLILSIILVILLVNLVFRGRMNTDAGNRVKKIALFWLFLNLMMVVTTAIKNHEYIIHWGLTYKRIGVHIYLLLAAIGLILTWIKVRKGETVWVLVRKTTLLFYTCFSLNGLMNWDKLIVNYNLTSLPAEQVDFHYLAVMQDEAYPRLIAYYAEHPLAAQAMLSAEEWDDLFICYNWKRNQLRMKNLNSTWRSFTIYEYDLLQRLEAVYPLYLTIIQS